MFEVACVKCCVAVLWVIFRTLAAMVLKRLSITSITSALVPTGDVTCPAPVQRSARATVAVATVLAHIVEVGKQGKGAGAFTVDHKYMRFLWAF